MPATSLSSAEREALILSHLPQVELLARSQHRKWPQIELDDLISAGTIGLIQAVDRYDPSRNLKLKTSLSTGSAALFWTISDWLIRSREVCGRSRNESLTSPIH